MRPITRRILTLVLSGMTFLLLLGGPYIRHQLRHAENVKLPFDTLFSCFESQEWQWATAICIGLYFAWITILKYYLTSRANAKITTGFWKTIAQGISLREIPLLSFMAIAIAAYAMSYPASAGRTDFLVLLCGATFAQTVGVFRTGQRNAADLYIFYKSVLNPLIFLFVAAAFFHPNVGKTFQFRGELRWTGPWDNPNTFGMLMGVGLILALGEAVEKFNSIRTRSNPQRLSFCYYLAATLVLLTALMKSYSRGAWIGTLCGLAYASYIWKVTLFTEKSQQTSSLSTTALDHKSRFFRRSNFWVGGALVASLIIFGFCFFRNTDVPVLRRSFSVANRNDFSQQNRLIASVAEMQIMGDNPWLGVGWNQPDAVYNRLYRPVKMVEGQNVFLNDYFMIGMTLGVPALLCLLMHFYLKLDARNPSDLRAENSLSPLFWQMAICRAAGLVFIIGFLPEHGFFDVSTGLLFWILLELGSTDLTICPRTTISSPVLHKSSI